ncbi:hypothetical protein HRbin03_00440 [archaeon HR03]|uniref:AAA family ATPase n=1 Tax=Caldiarchaeum subterraneum TaxID=311458 RepID=E6NAU7_CALS0|nr:AAA family ATPase [Candidatus Caldarchaeum subterraneum]GBC72609.1 hypothetical protein HRbin03_00440 [archaeon HR03]
MLFDLKPKERLKDLFGRESEYSELVRLVENGSWVAVLGKRMTGKTSLVKTLARERGGVYVNLLGARGLDSVMERILSASGLRLEELALTLGPVNVKWSNAAANVLEKIGDKPLVLDEVQDVASVHFLKILKNVWDTYGRLRLVFTGSYIGLMRNILEPSAGSPLYGRRPAVITLNPFSKEKSIEFLRKGFKQAGFTTRENELNEVVEQLNGYVGWLTYYGHFRCIQRKDHREALDSTLREGEKIILAELRNFLRNRKREHYIRVLKMVRYGARWSEIKAETGLNSKILADILKALRSAMLVDEEDGVYRISDLVTRRAVGRLRL